ncbi:TPA: Lrp/AsnC family transcriptional regulator [Candidatus Woesearchaeota archaeon]|nr:Lrp/AsnC family transcriptional regulator [Candidatus Woesearchaeota archaeon]
MRAHRNVVAYRIKKMEEAGILRGYFTEINNSVLGFTGYRVFFKFSNYNPEAEQKVVQQLLKDARVAWCFSVSGKWDLDIIYWCKSRFEFYELLQSLQQEFSSIIAGTEVSQVVDIYHYPKSYLVDAKRQVTLKKKLGHSTYELNDLQKRLLHIISTEARKDIIQISKELDASINTTKKYLAELQKQGIILSFRPFIDINALGYNYFKLHLYLQGYTEAEKKSLISYLEYDSNVVYLDFYINGADIEIEYHVRDQQEMNLKFAALREKFGKFIKDYFIIKFEREHVVRYLPAL